MSEKKYLTLLSQNNLTDEKIILHKGAYVLNEAALFQAIYRLLIHIKLYK